MPKRLKKRSKMEVDDDAATNQADAEAMSTRSALSHASEQSLDRLADFDDFENGEKKDVDERSAQEIFEDKLKEAIDGIIEKSLKGRMNSIKSLLVALRKRVITDFLQERHVTVCDALERSLKKGKGEEQAMAANALTLVCIQLGMTDEGEAVLASIKSLLLSVLQDPSASLLARAACANTLGLCGFIASSDLEMFSELLLALESIFSKSYLKGDKTPPSLSPQTCALHCSALESWSLLLSIATTSMVKTVIERQMHKLPELLESNDLDVRIAGGEALALLYELAWEHDEDYQGPHWSSLCDKLKQLSTENSKHQAKKNRKQQRSSFRDILHGIEDGEFKDFECKFGNDEVVYIDSWARKRQYDTLCSHLEQGLNTHLEGNPLLRDVFGLGPQKPSRGPSQKSEKNDRKLYHQAAFKARTQVRQKQRDKRLAQLSG